ncbi:MAG: methanogenesis marker 8 protein [Methanotrichaceae archaeon]
MTEHFLEMAKAQVKIADGKIEVLTDPQIKCCPLRRDLYGINEESRETVAGVLKGHLEDLGMYNSRRVLELNEKPVSFGASEILADAMAECLIDAAVVVCEGAGTVIVTKPEVLQAIGAHMTGLLRTESIKEIQEGLEKKGCIILDRLCTIDQVRGFERAAEAGFGRIAVTIAGEYAFVSKKLRELGEIMGKQPIILAVHTTGISRAEAEELADSCDIVWSCASKAVRETVGKKARLQIGISIPVFALTREGKRLVLNRALNFEDGLVINRASLPVVPEGKQPMPLL